LRLSLDDAQMIIREFDSDEDKKLNLEEFSALFLPTTN